jgi:hypothetical protein
MRYQEVMDNLALIASNGGVLPGFAVSSGGTANVTNTVSADAMTAINQSVNGFSQEVFNTSGTHNPELQWTVAPVVAEPNLEALHYACLWAVYGRPAEGSPAMELLRAPTADDVYACNNHIRPPGFHFNAAAQLDAIPPCWLHTGPRGNVPRHVCYKAHCGKKYVWVTAEGLEGLSAFTLVVLDLATTDPKSLVLPTPMVKVDIQLGTVTTTPVTPATVPPTKITKWTGSGTKVTEQWYACQTFGPTGSQIRITRPPWIQDQNNMLNVPIVFPDPLALVQPPGVPTPQFGTFRPSAAEVPGPSGTAGR